MDIERMEGIEKKKILIWGMGISGKAAWDLAKKWGMEIFGTDDKKEAASTFFDADHFLLAGELTYEWMVKQKIQQIVLSPGVPRQHPVILECIKNKLPVLGELEFAYQRCKIPIYAITGTNGKSTTVHMLRDALILLGKRPFLGGNVGIPFSYYYLDPKFSEYDCIVLEVSSFQCESLIAFRPLIAGILNLTESHTERYSNVADYAYAKLMLFKNMNSHQKVLLPSKQQQFFYSMLNKIPAEVVYYGENDQRELDFSQTRVVGNHNQENFSFVYRMLLEVFPTQDVRTAMQQLIGQFTSIEHRLEPCGEYKETVFYNDSKSTNVQSTLTAIDSFATYSPDYERWLILGGKKRSNHLSFLEKIKDRKTLTGILCIGDSTDDCCQFFRGEEKTIVACYTMTRALEWVRKMSTDSPQKKRIILLSPSFPSYDQYKNFEERGRHFKTLIKEIFV
ncbi:MAG: UDP-N-acetylmuramoyl-L-alanine--D-glutamate ligase [Bacteriovoracaceae bacterium]|nr:UDP-N-acetylmuramoyl-L-alanine--D-glutamate ligase [Bacteriovoracaceae bacterium]